MHVLKMDLVILEAIKLKRAGSEGRDSIPTGTSPGPWISSFLVKGGQSLSMLCCGGNTITERMFHIVVNGAVKNVSDKNNLLHLRRTVEPD